MKREVRFLGIDDAPFRRGDARVRLIGVVTRGAPYVEGVLSTEVDVDGDDATDAIVAMVRGSRFRPLVRCVFLSGVCVGGFNAVDLDRLHERLGLPIVTLSHDPPNPAAMRRALRAAFGSLEPRWATIARARPRRVRNGRHWVYANARGVTARDLPRLLALATVRGAFPEALRLADVMAYGLSGLGGRRVPTGTAGRRRTASRTGPGAPSGRG